MTRQAALERTLTDIVGVEHRTAGAALTDVTRSPIGAPRWAVRPGSTDEVRRIVLACRESRTPVVAIGKRTAYWRPLDVEGCVAIDVSRLDAMHPGDDGWRVGAGTAVRPLDHALRALGRCLPIHPDAYGDTSVGAMVATACTSGIGMGRGSIDDAVLGLEVVLGTGEVVRTGALALSDDRPFVRVGAPDTTGLFLGAEGTLGIVTELVLARRVAPFRVHVAARVLPSSLVALANLGRAWAGRYDTFRLVQTFEAPPRAGDESALVDLWIDSPWSSDEALARARDAASTLTPMASGITVRAETAGAREGRSPDHDARFLGPMTGHEEFASRYALVGVDVNAPYACLEGLLEAARELVADQLAAGVRHTRIALYLAPDFVNLGVHATLEDPRVYPLERAHRCMEALSKLGAVPYRAGHAWPASTRRAPTELARAVKRACDPDGILHPGHPAWR